MATPETSILLRRRSTPLLRRSSDMSLLLASTPVSAAICPTLSVNLLNRRRASIHDVDGTASVVDLPITVSFLNQEMSMSFSFTVVERDFGFEVLLGSQWESWCTQNKG